MPLKSQAIARWVSQLAKSNNFNIKEWPDARDTDEDSDSSVGRPDDMPAANHEVPLIT